MKKFGYIFAVALLLTTYSAVSWADCSAGHVCAVTGKITKLFVGESAVYIKTDQNQNALNCTQTSNSYLTLENSSGNYKEMYSALLSAMLGGLETTVRIREDTNNCKVLYVVVEPN